MFYEQKFPSVCNLGEGDYQLKNLTRPVLNALSLVKDFLHAQPSKKYRHFDQSDKTFAHEQDRRYIFILPVRMSRFSKLYGYFLLLTLLKSFKNWFELFHTLHYCTDNFTVGKEWFRCRLMKGRAERIIFYKITNQESVLLKTLYIQKSVNHNPIFFAKTFKRRNYMHMKSS